MSPSPMKFPRPRPRYRLVNHTRFISVILVFILALTAVFVILAKEKQTEDPAGDAAVVVTPVATPSLKPTPTPYPVPEGKTMEPLIVVLDAGHGGKDPGTESLYVKGFYEKDIVLDIVKKTQMILAEEGIKVMLTREGDAQLIDHSDKDLVARGDFANENNASLFVSVHVNSFDPKIKGFASVSGMEIYYYRNKPEIYEGFTQERFAEIMRDAVSNANGMKFRFMEGGRSLSVVRRTNMPAVLIETAYITNKEDHERLASDEFRAKTARGIADGILLAIDEIGAFEHEGEMYVFKEAGE